jgi:HEAT repeat protein
VRGHFPALAPELPSMLTSPVPATREAAARVLAERGPHAAPHVAALGALAQDPVPAVRVAAVAALDRIGLNSADVPAMLERFADDTASR